MSKSIALFDFDGTLTTKDTFLEFLKYAFGNLKFYWGFALHAPFLVAMKLKLYPNWKAKEKILTYFLKGRNVEEMKHKAASFCQEKLPQLIRKSGIEEIDTHIKKGNTIYIVSASASLWISTWCKQMKLQYIATELEQESNLYTGKIAGKNCYGPEKVNRIREVENLKEYELIYAYGDSSGDKEMLAIADRPHYKYFKD